MIELAKNPPSDHVARLIRHLRNAPVKDMLFTPEGRQQVCTPKYLLTSDRDFIISLLERTAMSNIVKWTIRGGAMSLEYFPGSDKAVDKGCICPADQPGRMTFYFADDCPVHELEKLPE